MQRLFESDLPSIALASSDEGNDQPTRYSVARVYNGTPDGNSESPVVGVTNVGRKKRRHGDAFMEIMSCIASMVTMMNLL